MQTMGERLKFCRAAFGWTQEDLAREAGVGIATIRRIEQRAIEPRLDTARRLAETFGVRDGWLISGEEPMVGLWQMSVEEQHRLQNGPGTKGLPGYVVIPPGPSGPSPWRWDEEQGWAVDRAAVESKGGQS